MYFHFTKRGRSGDAEALWDEYSVKFAGITGSPALVWITADGKAVRGTSGLTDCKNKLRDALENGSPGWWQPD